MEAHQIGFLEPTLDQPGNLQGPERADRVDGCNDVSSGSCNY